MGAKVEQRARRALAKWNVKYGYIHTIFGHSMFFLLIEYIRALDNNYTH